MNHLQIINIILATFSTQEQQLFKKFGKEEGFINYFICFYYLLYIRGFAYFIMLVPGTFKEYVWKICKMF